ncbi:MAG: acetyl-CoA acetyltransferase [Firmicutes bacterium HGW-Firmicutes-12]|nr:MAG: acetyl-CoA acetyltransferase [Firmicutes bacterium HGW-Firmicutes-12]
MAVGIKDKAAVVGMGCSKFGERFDCSLEDLMLEAVTEALKDANIEFNDIDAFWFGTYCSGLAGDTFSNRMKSQYKPVTRIENKCCTGTDAFRNACYAVISGACDVAMAIGAEKLKDGGYSGLAIPNVESDRTVPDLSAPAMFAFLGSSYAHKYGLTEKQLRGTLARIAFKNHSNGALNPKAMFQAEVPMKKILESPVIAYPLTLMDCSGVADGCSCAIITRTEDAKKYRNDPMYVKAMQIAAGPAHSERHQSYDFTTVKETCYAAEAAYREAGITEPRNQINLAEVHDCFTVTELTIYEDLLLSERGDGWKDVMRGVFDRGGVLPVNIDGGLKSFGHPIGASGIRMLYEMWLQFHEKAGLRQRENPKLGLTHNMGGTPYSCVAGVTIVGKELG